MNSTTDSNVPGMWRDGAPPSECVDYYVRHNYRDKKFVASFFPTPARWSNERGEWPMDQIQWLDESTAAIAEAHRDELLGMIFESRAKTEDECDGLAAKLVKAEQGIAVLVAGHEKIIDGEFCSEFGDPAEVSEKTLADYRKGAS